MRALWFSHFRGDFMVIQSYNKVISKQYSALQNIVKYCENQKTMEQKDDIEAIFKVYLMFYKSYSLTISLKTN